jgi:hypothetical protein
MRARAIARGRKGKGGGGGNGVSQGPGFLIIEGCGHRHVSGRAVAGLGLETRNQNDSLHDGSLSVAS